MICAATGSAQSLTNTLNSAQRLSLISFVMCAGSGDTSAEAKANAEAQLKARHAGERAGRCWGARPGLSQSEATRAAITQLLQVEK